MVSDGYISMHPVNIYCSCSSQANPRPGQWKTRRLCAMLKPDTGNLTSFDGSVFTSGDGRRMPNSAGRQAFPAALKNDIDTRCLGRRAESYASSSHELTRLTYEYSGMGTPPGRLPCTGIRSYRGYSAGIAGLIPTLFPLKSSVGRFCAGFWVPTYEYNETIGLPSFRDVK